ncbi:MAG: HAD-IC family P-type ATPase [Thermoanaerobaculia bacterium]|nr:MAG: HAD-IC family P-type ATPase [Thermoanaerobaculia bacterium]
MSTREPGPTRGPHELAIAEVAASLGADLERGLSEAEATQRLERDGRNELVGKPPVPGWRRFLAQFRDLLVVLLLVATAISLALWALERETTLPWEAFAIFAVVLFNATLGFVQERRAEAALAALEELSADEAQVLRDGEVRRIPATGLVPGDLLLLEEGDTIPADARLFETAALQTAEAALTGESLPVAKTIDPLPGPATLADRHNMVWSGTAVTYGHGRALVTATGMATEVGLIAGLLGETREEPTPLQRDLARLGRLLGAAVLALAVAMSATIILVSHVRSTAALLDVLILGVALAVAAVPEGLPAVVTAVLAIGVQRLARRQAIVRHLARIMHEAA